MTKEKPKYKTYTDPKLEEKPMVPPNGTPNMEEKSLSEKKIEYWLLENNFPNLELTGIYDKNEWVYLSEVILSFVQEFNKEAVEKLKDWIRQNLYTKDDDFYKEGVWNEIDSIFGRFK